MTWHASCLTSRAAPNWCDHKNPIPTKDWRDFDLPHYDDVIMGAMASQITSLTIVYSTVYSGTDQSKHQSSALMAFVCGIHRGPVNSPHKWPVTRKCFHLMTPWCWCSILSFLTPNYNYIFLNEQPWISPWIKSISNELDTTFHVLTSQLSRYVFALRRHQQ